MKRRIFWSIFVAVVGGVLLMGACVVGLVYYKTTQNTWSTLSARAYYFSCAIDESGLDYLEKVRGYSGRITLVGADGTVLFDDREVAANMENHAGREEVVQALQSGTGRAQRVSGTLGERTLYYALRLSNGSVLRVSTTASSVIGETLSILPWMLVVIALLAIAAGIIAKRQTGAIVAPINQIDLDAPMETDAYGELSPFLRRIAAQKTELARQMETLRQSQTEFDTITGSMDEGLVVLNRDGNVFSLNQSARRILDVQEGEVVGRHILMLNRNVAMDAVIRQTVDGQKASAVIELGQRQYRVTASPSVFDGRVQGIVLLFLDETDKLLAEQRRREFSANVSHELKTPLTSISGYAEIIHNGLAKSQDVQAFAGFIYEEANRLIELVQDIIKLSRLDEKQGALDKQPLDLSALTRKVAEGLAPMAEQSGLKLSFEGKEVTVSGVPSILEEVVYNLIDNAIHYSEKGTIEVRVKKEPGMAVLAVRDEGIGIPKEHQEQVFERFYRVDKSHSRDSGGTGLGLAIVKRGVLFHEGSVELESEPGKGSTFTITIPSNI